jgi:LacI family transcriptional regulator
MARMKPDLVTRLAAAPDQARSRADVPAARPVSLADVAALAGVSAGTVSRVLSRPDMISAATSQKVLAAAERLGYVANGAARALALRKSRTIGALVPRFGSSSFPTLVQAMESALAAQGYTLLLSAPDHARAQDPAVLRALLERGVDAVALLGAEQPAAVFNMLHQHGIPFVLLWALASPQGPSVGFDEHQAAALVVDHLADLGHQFIGFIGGKTSDNERARRRFSGVLQAMARRGLTLCTEAHIETEYGFEPGFKAMQTVLARQTAATAMVCGNDYLAAGALSALDAAGVAVPVRMSVISFNDNDFAPYLHPPLTTARVPIREMGETAARYLLDRLSGEPPSEPLPLPVELVPRRSTGPVPASD